MNAVQQAGGLHQSSGLRGSDATVQPSVTAQPRPADGGSHVDGQLSSRRSPGRRGNKRTQELKTDSAAIVPVTEYGPYDPRGEQGRNFGLCLCMATIVGILCWWLNATVIQRTDSHLDPLKRTHKPVPEDTYGFAVVSLIRDFHLIARDQWQWKLRISRIISSFMIIVLNTGLQLYMMYQIKKFVTAKWVHDIRVDYDEYQQHMYGPHTVIAADGKHRGIPGFYNPSAFDTLENGLKERVCNIPFSQTAFFTSILFIWSLTCIGEIRACVSMFLSLIMTTPTISSMGDALKVIDEEGEDDQPLRVVAGLTATLKAAISLVVILPRLLLTMVLLWLGSRFLAATNDFSELVLNTIALEFLLMLKDLLYTTIVPDRNKREIQNIVVLPSEAVEHPSFWAYLGTFSWALVAICWVFSYVYYFQSVLPNYNWDVAAPCTPWVKMRFAV